MRHTHIRQFVPNTYRMLNKFTLTRRVQNVSTHRKSRPRRWRALSVKFSRVLYVKRNTCIDSTVS